MLRCTGGASCGDPSSPNLVDFDFWEASEVHCLSSMENTLRRRLHHRDVDGRKDEYLDSLRYDALNEPLLAVNSYEGHYKGYDDGNKDWDDKKKEVNLHWAYLFSNLIAQWSQWLANLILGSGSFLGRFLPLSTSNDQKDLICLSPLQEERLRTMRNRLGVQFDGSRLDHQDALKNLWRLAYPNDDIPPLKSELWKEMGWQGCDPSTDFRGAGFISLENLIFFAKNYPNSFQALLHKTEGARAEWEYPFAVAGVNISFMLMQMLDLQSVLPSSKPGVRFLELLAGDEKAFDNLYCVAFCMLDAQWLAKRASYMEFNEVMKSTRMQLERELSLEDVTSVRDLPAYSLLM